MLRALFGTELSKQIGGLYDKVAGRSNRSITMSTNYTGCSLTCTQGLALERLQQLNDINERL
jgi:hypothetical protein